MCQTDGRGGGEYFRPRSVSWQCHANGDKARKAKTKTAKKKKKVNLTLPILSKLAESLRFLLAPANCDEFGFKALAICTFRREARDGHRAE